MEDENQLRNNTGVVKRFNDKKGFGFIIPDDGSEELFVHYTSILSKGFRRLVQGETVEFAIYFGGDGLTKAVDVKVTNGVPVPGNIRGGGGGGGYLYNFVGEGRRRDGDYGNRGGGGKTCFNCDKGGHREMNCYQGGDGGCGGRGGRRCYNCGECGHFARECPHGAR